LLVWILPVAVPLFHDRRYSTTAEVMETQKERAEQRPMKFLSDAINPEKSASFSSAAGSA
jgi:hypothetical protein